MSVSSSDDEVVFRPLSPTSISSSDDEAEVKTKLTYADWMKLREHLSKQRQALDDELSEEYTAHEAELEADPDFETAKTRSIKKRLRELVTQVMAVENLPHEPRPAPKLSGVERAVAAHFTGRKFAFRRPPPETAEERSQMEASIQSASKLERILDEFAGAHDVTPSAAARKLVGGK